MSPANASYERIAFASPPIPEAHEALKRLTAIYGNVAPRTADVIVALGGDGPLQTLHWFAKTASRSTECTKTVNGFLMNEYAPDDRPQRLRTPGSRSIRC